MSAKRYMNAKEAAAALDVSLSTLYAYVSRGLIRSEQAPGSKRERRYYAEDIKKLLARKDGRMNPEKLAADALHWGSPVMDSAITLIDGGDLYYRGLNVRDLAETATIEEVAALIWLGNRTNAETLFDLDVHAQKYETMLLHAEIDGITLSPVEELQTMLPAAAVDSPSAYDFRPSAVAQTGARLLRLMTSVLAGDVPENVPIARMLQRGWCPNLPESAALFDKALIVMADHELNASSFAARVVASAGGNPYAAVQGGLSALQGTKHGGETARVIALLNEVESSDQIEQALTERLRRGESLPGFGHHLYPQGDPRARLLLDALFATYPDHPQTQLGRRIVESVAHSFGDTPNVDTALVLLARILGLPPGSPLALFALGRTVGWIGHIMEQYEQDRLIRPRARYTGPKLVQ